MVLQTRRRLLHGVAALAAGLAGCGESTRRSTPTATAHHPENVARNPEQFALRNPDDEPAVRVDTSKTTRPGDEERSSFAGNALVASAERASLLGFADVDGAEDARRFVAETDFETETLYVDQQVVRECYEVEFCYVTWSETEIQTSYGRTYRDHDVACSTDEQDRVATLIRIPEALDPDSVRSHGRRGSSGSCHYPPEMREGSATSSDESTHAPAESDGGTDSSGSSR